MHKLLLALLLLAPRAVAQEGIIGGDCRMQLDAALAAHHEPPMSAIHVGTAPEGQVYLWEDGAGQWALVFLKPGYGMKKQPWGQAFTPVGQCSSDGETYTVWFAKYQPGKA